MITDGVSSWREGACARSFRVISNCRRRKSAFNTPRTANRCWTPGRHLRGRCTSTSPHSGDLALVAVTGVGETGVDLEEIRPEFPCERVARHFFSASEVLSLGSLVEEERTEAFFRCWTRKEAFIKANGQGLSLRLDQFDVSLEPEEPPALLRTAWDVHEAAHWSLRTLQAGPGHAAALAVRGHDYELRLRQL